MLLWELLRDFLPYSGTFGPNSLLSWLFGISPLVRSFSISIMDSGILVFSSLMSLSIHEFGHAIAASSEGIQSEYIAIFLAIIFPGALVAFNNDLLQSLPHFSALRIYCAGIWHNLMFSAVCGLALFLLPALLYPLHIHGKGPMVLGLPETSPLSWYLAHGDVIESVDGSNISFPHEWMRKMKQIHTQSLTDAVSSMKGYCVPNLWVEVGKNIQSGDDQFSCPDELAAFVENRSLDSGRSEPEANYCLMAKDVVKLKKCGEGWQMNGASRNNFTCTEGESCMAPLSPPGISWVEISYSSPYSSECLLHQKNLTGDYESLSSGSTPCGGTFVFIGDALSMAISVRLSSYRPRWPFLMFSASIPTMLEKILNCNFHVSATYAFLNSLPVYFLDGASILETCLGYLTWLKPSRRHRLLRICLFTGTTLSVFGFSKVLYATTLQYP